MKTKSLIALSILCLVLGACASTDTAKDPNVASPEDHANQTSAAARQNDVGYSTLTPNTEQTTIATTTTEPVWTSNVENPPAADSTLAQSSTTVTESTTSTTSTTSTPDTMASSSTVSDDDDDDTTTATETRTRLRKD